MAARCRASRYVVSKPVKFRKPEFVDLLRWPNYSSMTLTVSPKGTRQPTRSRRPRIRRLRHSDSKQVAEIAARSVEFTVPTAYVIWMLAKTQAGLCYVALGETGNLDGYVLALRGSDPKDIFLWQLGLRGTPRTMLGTATALGRALFEYAVRHGVRRALFTARATSGDLVSAVLKQVPGLELSPQRHRTGPTTSERSFVIVRSHQ